MVLGSKRIHAKDYTDNVVDLMVGKLRRLPIETQNALRQLACLGNVAKVATLSDGLSDARRMKVHADLLEAVRLQLVRATGGLLQIRPRPCPGGSLFADSGGIARRSPSQNWTTSRGAHARGEARGGDLRDRQSAQPGVALITSQEEREHLAEFNLIAGKRAKASTAYASALKYLIAGRRCWATIAGIADAT